MSVANKKRINCSGCNACEEVCPKHCINMVADKKGFLYPKVNTTVCIDCNACEKVCPFEEGNIKLTAPLTAYAAWNKNREQYLASSSGGLAHVFSSYIIKQGGIVYGCTSEGMRIRHTRVESLSELSKLQGSKYVQSDVRGLFSQIKADLRSNKSVLFIGTPCQIAGLKNYIKRIPEHLYLIDLICHGVSSQQMLFEHINLILNGHTAEQLSFRKGQQFRIEVVSRCGTAYASEAHKDMYYRAFLSGISYRESCYRCPFAHKERISDITIGDFWKLQNADSLPLNIEEGVSLLLPISEKGKFLIDAVKSNIHIYERSIEEAINGNGQLCHPVKETIQVKLFRTLYAILSFDKAVTICIVHQRLKTLLKIIRQKILK